MVKTTDRISNGATKTKSLLEKIFKKKKSKKTTPPHPEDEEERKEVEIVVEKVEEVLDEARDAGGEDIQRIPSVMASFDESINPGQPEEEVEARDGADILGQQPTATSRDPMPLSRPRTTMLSTFITEARQFYVDMYKHSSTGVKVWTAMYPLQQLLWGAWSAVAVGPASLGAQYFYQRVLSTLMVNRIHAKRAFDKKMGPIPHANMYLTLLPYSFQWLSSSKPSKSATTTDKIHYGFILYATITTSVSLLLDSKVIYQMIQGKDPGLYPFAPKASDDNKAE